MNKDEIRNEMRRISQVLQTGTAEEVLKLRAPGSGNPLKVRFIGGEKVSVNVQEIDGEFSVCLDGLEARPVWVDELGCTFATKQAL